MMKSTLIKLRGLSLHCRPALPVFSAEHTLLYMCFKYNHEFVDGQRPALRKVTEGDVPAGSVMVVFFVSLSKDERLSPHTSTGVVSDGFYHVKVSLDVPLTNLLREGKLRRGQKVMMCGAKMLKKDNCTPLECMGEVVLSLSYNCVKPVEPCTALGLYHVCPPVVVPSAIDELGGMVPSLQGVVERVLPPFFIEQPFKRTRDTNARDGGSGGGKVVRNLLAQLKFHDRTSRGGNEEMCEAGKRQLMRVTSFSLTCMHKGDVVLQLWDDFSNGCATEALEEDTCAYPAEGSTIVVFALTPSRFRPSHPFHHAKVLYSRSPLDYRVLSPPDKGGTRLPERAVDSVAAEIVTGGPVDVAGLFVATATVSNFNSHVIAMLQDDWCPGKSSASYCVIDAPLATASKEITLAMPSAPFTPVIVQNASFIKRAEDLGNDCIHTLANEFTRVLTRPATPALRSVVDSLEQLRHTAKTCRVITSRCEELLRLRTLSEEAQSDVRRLACESVGIDVVTTTSSDTSTSRLPYYLREKEAPFKQGVTLPKEKVTVSSSTARESLVNDTPMPLAAAPLRHLFGNVVGFRLIKCHDSGRTERIDLFAVYVAGSSSESVSSDEPPAEDPQRSSHFEIDVQFGATTQQRLTAQINVPRVLHALLEPRITLQRACALAVDEVIPEYSICRAKQLEKWRGAREECWWRFLTRSCVVSARSHDLEAVLEPGDAVEWLASEWDILLEILSSEIRNCLFKFSVENGELTRAVFIREHCNIVNLMRK
ncbi:unnamed protein product [Trypanosoma congolense IL3000]|uniref:WGS project CAEQ00000000 data, annotated contig 1666 n=1 Tax=Trypanosoma congolense (strain IL3000) TaxID=1068625 RepID=F9W7W8_TRYCI|nr:unnamed protein product [Trypanosoma congolense IL3000]